MQRLTDRTIQAVKPTARETKVFDTLVRGLALRVYPSGTKAYAFFYTNHLGKQRQISLGGIASVSLADARQRARQYAAEVGSGIDPAERKSEYRRAETIGQLAEKFIAHARIHAQPRTVREYEQQLKRDILPNWADIKIQAIRTADVIALIDGIHSRGAPILANRTQALVSRLFSFAKERRLVEHNPVAGLPKPAKETSKIRVLSDEEVRWLWEVTDCHPNRSLSLSLRLILLTGLRPGEVAGAMKCDLDFVANHWLIPGERTKNRDAHFVPLLSEIRDVLRHGLEEASNIHGDSCKYVFPATKKDTPQNLSKLLKTNFKQNPPDGFMPFTCHDLRRTTLTRLQNLGEPHEVIELIAGHKLPGISSVYQRGDRRTQIESALAKWHRELRRIVYGQDSRKVLPIR